MTSTAEIAAAMLAEPSTRASTSGRSLSDVLDELRGAITDHRPIIKTLTCGWELIDDTVGGLVRGEYVGFVAGPGVGKSTLGDQLLLNTLLRNPELRGIILALETAAPVRAARLLAGRCVHKNSQNKLVGVVPVRALLLGELRDAGTATALRGLEDLERQIGGRLTFVDSVSDDAQIADLIASERPDVLLLDHLGLVTTGAETLSETAKMDASLSRILASIRDAGSAGILINEVSKASLATGRIDIVASRGSARFASLASLYVGLERIPGTVGKEQMIQATIHKSRFGGSHKRQLARFHGGLAHFEWATMEDVDEQDHQDRKRGRRVSRNDTRTSAPNTVEEESEPEGQSEGDEPL